MANRSNSRKVKSERPEKRAVKYDHRSNSKVEKVAVKTNLGPQLQGKYEESPQTSSQEETEDFEETIIKTAVDSRVPEELKQRSRLEEQIVDLKRTSASERKEWKTTTESLKQQLDDLRRSQGDVVHQLERERARVLELEDELETTMSRLREFEEKTTTDVQLEAMSQTIKDLEEERDFLKRLARDGKDKDPEIADGAIDYRYLETTSSQSLIRPLASTEDTLEVTGLALLGNELFIASRNSPTVEVWNLETLCFKRRWMLARLLAPTDLKQCPVTRCLYLVNEVCGDDGRGSCVTMNEILRVDTRGCLLKSWTIDDAFGNISVAEDTNVILAAANKNQVYEYFSNGSLSRTVRTPWTTAIEHLNHAFKLTSNQFLICHGAAGDALHQVCIMDVSGDVLKSYGKEWTTDKLNCPVYLERDSGGNVLVVDGMNGRVLALDSNLELMSVLVTSPPHRRTSARDSRTHRPRKICLDEERSRLFVAEDVFYDEENQETQTLHSRILSSFVFCRSGTQARRGWGRRFIGVGRSVGSPTELR